LTSSTSLTFYGGVKEIGGNKILLEDKDTRIFLDFGKSFSRRAKFFEEYISPRTSNGIVDFITMGLVPDIPGIYREDLMRLAGRKVEKPDIDGVLLSHAHSDHADYISFLHEEIPIYMGKACHLILEALGERSSRMIEREILDFKPRPANKKDKPIKRKIETFRTGDKFKIGSLEVEPIHVDHSVPGAYGFIIYSSEGPIVYTGDIRLHGTKSQMTRDFIKKARDVKPIALISEGTRIADEPKEESEERVSMESGKIVSETDRLVLVDFNFKDVDRLRTFYNIAKENGRKFVVKINDAYFLKYLSQDLIQQLNKNQTLKNFENGVIKVFEFTQNELDWKSWNFVPKEINKIYEKIASSSQRKLGDLTEKLYEGFVSGDNDIFFVDSETINEHHLENELLRPSPKARDVRNYYVDWSDRFILFPYCEHEGKTTRVSIDNYPNTKRYLEKFKKRLASRRSLKGTSKKWYEMIRPREFNWFENDKIICPSLSNKNNFCIDLELFVISVLFYVLQSIS
jgi:mRNA degradation ribonuclease J1/J2